MSKKALTIRECVAQMSCISDRFDEFMAVAEKQSFSKAAKELYVSQTTISRHIKELEDYYGTKLFERNGTLSLTAAGNTVLRYFSEIETSLKALDEEIALLNEKEQNTVYVQNYSADIYFYNLLMQARSEMTIDRNINILQINTPRNKSTIEAVQERTLDIGTILTISEGGEPAEIYDGICRNKLISLSSELKFRVSKRNPYAEKTQVKLYELQSLPILMPTAPEYQQTKSELIKYFQRHGCTPLFRYIEVGDRRDYFMQPIEDCCMMFRDSFAKTLTPEFEEDSVELKVEDWPATLESWLIMSPESNETVKSVYGAMLKVDKKRANEKTSK